MPNTPTPVAPRPSTNRRKREDGVRSREAILLAAARAASVHGFEGLSIGTLAKQLGMSKSGLFAHFGSKEELELATIDAADRIFGERVVVRVTAAAPGLARLREIANAFFDHVQSGVFPGGCFFAAVAAGVVAIPGRVRDRVMGCISDWSALLGRCVAEARELGEIGQEVDAEQIVFEIRAMLQAANQGFVLTRDPKVFERARASIEEIFRRAAPVSGGVKVRGARKQVVRARGRTHRA